MSGEPADAAVADPGFVDNMELQSGEAPPTGACSFTGYRIVAILKIILVICQTIILIIGAVYISWWPSNINIYASEGNNEESLGNTEDENRVLQIWQSIYLGLNLICTFYGAGMQDRGWLMISMFMNFGIMSLLPFRSGGSEAPFTVFILIFGTASVTVCFILSERIQNKSLMDDAVAPADVKKKVLCCDLPDLTIYHMGVLQALTSCIMIFVGLLWMLLQEAMITLPERTFSCNGWPGGECNRYYGFKAQEYYVSRMTIGMCVAGAAGGIGGFLKYRVFATLAMVITLIPFNAIIENGIYTLGNSEDVRYMCSDTFWQTEVDGVTRLAIFWGEDFDCASQETYHKTSVVFMIIASSVCLLHLWICLRFSEKIQSLNETMIDEELPNWFDRLCEWFMDSKRLVKLLLVLSLFVGIGGIVQIAYGADAASSKQEEESWSGDFVFVLDSPAFIDASYIYGILAVLSAASIWLYFCYKDRAILCLVFCLLVETHAIGFQNLIWHEIALDYGIVGFALNNVSIYPTYINGDARDTLYGSVQVYYIFNILIMITIFISLVASEAIQEEKKDDMRAKTRLPMGILD